MYQKLVNKYINRVDPEHKKSRLLYPGEYHIPLHNFSGPGTRLDIPGVKEFPAYNHIDEASKIHDLEYDEVKHSNLSPEEKAKEIQKSDKKAISVYDKYPNEYGHDLAKAGISGKVSLEALLSLLKGRATTIYGGIIHNFISKSNSDKLYQSRIPKYYTDEEKHIINILRLNKDAIMKPIGSFTFSIQKYPSDIDVNEIVVVTDYHKFLDDLKKLIMKIEESGPNILFSDFKVGNVNGDATKWTADEIINGRKEINGKIYNLEDLLKQESIIKLDILAFMNNRIIEASAFFVLVTKEGEFLNLPNNFLELFEEQLKKDIKEYKNIKTFKAVKRLWSLSRLHKDTKKLRKLAKLIDSNISILSQINADIESIILLLEKYPSRLEEYKSNLKNIFDEFNRKLSTIADINIPYDEISKVFIYLKNNIDRISIGEFVGMLDMVHEIILSIINDETKKYLHYKKIKL